MTDKSEQRLRLEQNYGRGYREISFSRDRTWGDGLIKGAKRLEEVKDSLIKQDYKVNVEEKFRGIFSIFFTRPRR
mgnify:CR=1 FL=1